MKVTEHYDRASEPLISFEIIPPKRGGSIKTVFDALDKVVSTVKPPFIDVTYHAPEVQVEEQSDGTLKKVVRRKRPGTIGLCAAILHRYGIDPVPHLLCGGFSRESAEDALIELNYLGIHNVLALRGDDHGSEAPYPVGGSKNRYASDLVAQIQDMNQGNYLEKLAHAEPTDFCVGVAGYPEKHFEAPNLDWDIKKLKEKVDAGAHYVVTQMFFDNSRFFDFVERCRDQGITVPIIPGLKILTTPNHLSSLPKFFHLNIPDALANSVEKDPKNTKSIGIEWAQKQCLELMEGGVPGIHFYVMGDPQPALDVIRFATKK
ncbi:MAG: methylenetetrahydrofolate reductase [NAD(P)H] [Balneolaceae bacterium]|nr:MAG: methylenetetrahydrofolate reductase [NAD(P)H] [Balneolaceae bacterium]